MKLEFSETELVFLRSAIKSRWSLRNLGHLLGVSRKTDGDAFTDEFVMSLLKKLGG